MKLILSALISLFTATAMASLDSNGLQLNCQLATASIGGSFNGSIMITPDWSGHNITSQFSNFDMQTGDRTTVKSEQPSFSCTFENSPLRIYPPILVSGECHRDMAGTNIKVMIEPSSTKDLFTIALEMTSDQASSQTQDGLEYSCVWQEMVVTQ